MKLPSNESRILSKLFQREVERCKTYAVIWKRMYGYSSNDERWLTATDTQILQDLIESDAIDFIQEFEAYGPEMREILTKKALGTYSPLDDAEQIAAQLNRAQGL